MKAVIKIHHPKVETRLPAEEQAARQRRAAAATPALPGTRQPFKTRASAPSIRKHGGTLKNPTL